MTLLSISINYKVLPKPKSLQSNSAIQSSLIYNFYIQFQSRWQDLYESIIFQNFQSFKKLSKKYLRPYKIIFQLNTLLFTLCLLKSIHSIYLVFYVSILELTIFNTFPKRTWLVSALVIVNRKSEYEIL